jgi:hypothetical protein
MFIRSIRTALVPVFAIVTKSLLSMLGWITRREAVPPRTIRPPVGTRNWIPVQPPPFSLGETSPVLVISTNAMLFTAGNASVIDGGVTTVAAFEPAAVPGPASLLLLGGGLLALGGVRRFRA